MTARRHRASDGRWHFRHGPIELVIQADGDEAIVEHAHASAWGRFCTILDELVIELPRLRTPLPLASPAPSAATDRRVATTPEPRGPVAMRMWNACLPHRARFITPMAAVAGAVADELVAHYRRPGIRRAWINNGGDIALHLSPGASCRVGVFADLARFRPAHASQGLDVDADFAITHAMPVRGIATSGWRGRSFSFGIADSATVLARDAATADAAATMIANAVDVDDARIVRRPASTLKDDGDLGDRLVTVDVPPLGIAAVRRALSSGLAHAEALRAEGIIASCVLACQGMMVATGRFGQGLRKTADDDAADDVAWHATRLMHEGREAIA